MMIEITQHLPRGVKTAVPRRMEADCPSGLQRILRSECRLYGFDTSSQTDTEVLGGGDTAIGTTEGFVNVP